jgi:hypothetical protein
MRSDREVVQNGSSMFIREFMPAQLWQLDVCMLYTTTWRTDVRNDLHASNRWRRGRG